ncbi:MAG: hypothetical protein ACKOW2_04965 [Sphingobacteriaceae bacterium]
MSKKEVLEMSFFEAMRLIEEHNYIIDERNKKWDKESKEGPKGPKDKKGIMDLQGMPGVSINIHH